jgi:hypothetical protein
LLLEVLYMIIPQLHARPGKFQYSISISTAAFTLIESVSMFLLANLDAQSFMFFL